MAFNRPSLSDLVSVGESELNALVSGADARMRFSVLNVFVRIWAALADGLYSALQFLSKQFFATTATGQYLEQIGASYGINRGAATASTGKIRVYGTAGSSVPIDTIFSSVNGNQYRVVLGKVITGLYVEVDVISETVGLNTNLAASSVVSSTSPIAGVTSSIVAADGISGGSDTQTDNEYRVSLLRKIQNPCGAGTVSDWTAWAFEFGAIVTRVWTIPLVYGNGTVGVVFTVDNAGVIPAQSTVDAMQAHLNKYAPAGSVVYAIAPTLKTVDFNISVNPSGSPEVQNQILSALETLFYREAYPANTIPQTHVAAAISSASSEYDHTLNSPIGALQFAGTSPTFEVGKVGVITWS